MTDKENDKASSAKTLNRKDIAKRVKRETGLPLDVSAEVVSQIFGHISDALSRGDHVKLAGFGTFNLRQKNSRLGRNPKTGEECIIRPRTVLTFKPSALMRERIQTSLSAPQISEKKNLLLKPNCAAESVANRAGKMEKTKPARRAQWIALFEVLGLVAFAGSSMSERKVETLIDAAVDLKFVIAPKAPVTQKSIASWVKLNRKKLLASVENETFKPKFQNNLKILQDISHKSDIIFSMVRIAIADGIYSDLEKSLISQTILQWDMPSKVVDDIEYICANIKADPHKVTVS